MLDELRHANRRRQAEWPGNDKCDLPFRAIEFLEEAGEVAGAIKKYLRDQRGIEGSKLSVADIQDEMGDVLVTLDLLADELGIDLSAAVVQKFNKTSVKHDFKTMMYR